MKNRKETKDKQETNYFLSLPLSFHVFHELHVFLSKFRELQATGSATSPNARNLAYRFSFSSISSSFFSSAMWRSTTPFTDSAAAFQDEREIGHFFPQVVELAKDEVGGKARRARGRIRG